MMLICLHLLLLTVIDGLPLAKIPMNNLHHMFTSPEDNHNLLNQIVSSKDDQNVLLNIVANADPAKLHDIIVLIRVLLVASENELAGLTSESGNADVAYTNAVNANNAAIIAQTNGITQLSADLDVAQAAAQTIYDQGVVNLQEVVDASNVAKDAASGAKNTANGVLSSERSRLESEISSLKQVIALIQGVIGINTVAPTVAPIPTVYKVDFGSLDINIQQGFTPIGGPDTTTSRISGSVGPLTVSATGYQVLKGGYPPVREGPYVGQSNLLRSGIICYHFPCAIEIRIEGLTTGNAYSIKSYHHDTNNVGNEGSDFSISWNGETPVVLAQSQVGGNIMNAWTPSLTHVTTFTAHVTPDVNGVATALITKLPGKHHIDVNGLEISPLAGPGVLISQDKMNVDDCFTACNGDVVVPQSEEETLAIRELLPSGELNAWLGIRSPLDSNVLERNGSPYTGWTNWKHIFTASSHKFDCVKMNWYNGWFGMWNPQNSNMYYTQKAYCVCQA